MQEKLTIENQKSKIRILKLQKKIWIRKGSKQRSNLNIEKEFKAILVEYLHFSSVIAKWIGRKDFTNPIIGQIYWVGKGIFRVTNLVIGNFISTKIILRAIRIPIKNDESQR